MSSDAEPNSKKGDSSNPQAPAAQEEEEARPPGCIASCLALCTLCVACLCCLAVCPLICCCVGTHNAAQKAQGKRYDGKQRKWVIDNLDEEGKTVANVPDDDSDILKKEEEEETDDDAEKAVSKHEVKETAYYEALGVATDADESKIKRAYYVKARKWHPDRNDSDEAKEKFQKIGEAYQVLSDPKLRAIYDKEGEDGLSGDRTEASPDSIDPSLVFTFLFGNDAFSDIIGRLQVVTMTMAAGDDDDEEGGGEGKIGRKEFMEIERRRVIRLALKLVERVQRYVDGSEEAAKTQWREEAKRLVEARYGNEILNVVGSTYRLVATQCIGSWREGAQAQIDEHEIQKDAAKAAAQGAQAMQQSEGEGGDEDKLPHYIGMMWNVTVIDITSTLREVVMKALHDVSVSSDIRKKRAEAVIALGEIFEAQESTNEKHKSVRGLYMSATQAAMEETLNKAREEEERTQES